MENVKIYFKGNIHKYIELIAEPCYCFYDVDEEYRHYITKIATPIIDENELTRKYIVVKGNADKLNEEFQNEQEVNDGTI